MPRHGLAVVRMLGLTGHSGSAATQLYERRARDGGTPPKAPELLEVGVGEREVGPKQISFGKRFPARCGMGRRGGKTPLIFGVRGS